MKKIILLGQLILWAALSVFGQADTVIVPSVVDGSPFGAINKFILGDTLDNGERVNPDRYYKLEKDKIYFLDGILFANFDFRLIADDVQEGEKPPIVASTAGSNGEIQLIQFKFFQNAYIKNIICQMTPPSGNGESNAAFFCSGEGKNYEFDNVRVEWGLWTGIVTEKPVNKVVIRNCYFRNQMHKTNIWNGRGFGFYQENPADTVIMQNNTFFNMNSFAFFADISSIPPNYFLFDHNTIVNTMKFPLHSFWLPNAIVTNNIFYNTHSYGETSQDKVGQDPDLLDYGIINISPIPSDLIEYYGIQEGDRKYLVKNNGYFHIDPIKVYWQEYGLGPTIWMNSRTMDMFGDDAAYPYLDGQAPIVGDPGFVEPGDAHQDMIKWMKNKRDLKGNTYWGWDPDGDKFLVTWPFPEDLSYTNEEMLTAASGGFPLGDLNWFKDQKEAWETWMLTATNDISPATDIRSLDVTPNPASHEVEIDFELAQAGHIDISIFDLSGHKVEKIFSDFQSSGKNSFFWTIPATLNSGIYLIRITDKKGIKVKQLVINN